MDLVIKKFEELTTAELYEILKVRSAVFVVEQKCAYQDLDDLDDKSLHVFYEENRKILAYLRAFYKEKDVVQIGRVLTMRRGTGLGKKILREGIAQVKDRMPCRSIYIEAQSYATGFYEREGFRIVSDEFLEDGIPHVKMELSF